MRLTIALVALVAAAALSPLAQAHVESYSQSRALEAGPFLVFFDPRPTPPFAEHASSLLVQVSDASTGTLLRDASASVVVGGPDGFNERKPLQSDGRGYQIASMIFPAAGNYSARVLVQDASNETHAADTEFEVFPNLPFRIRPVQAELDVYTGERTPIAFEVVDPTTLSRKDAFETLEVRVEHWTEDHSRLLGTEPALVEKTGVGIWRVDHLFKEAGMHHIRFASEAGGFNYADVPLLHVYAISPEQAGVATTDSTPGPGLLGALVAAGVALALLRKR